MGSYRRRQQNPSAYFWQPWHLRIKFEHLFNIKIYIEIIENLEKMTSNKSQLTRNNCATGGQPTDLASNDHFQSKKIFLAISEESLNYSISRASILSVILWRFC